MTDRLSRRRFLKLGCAGIGSTTLYSSLVHLGAFSSAASVALPSDAAEDDYRALVCILLAGGADSFNMLIPTDPGGYQQYRQARGDLALDGELLLPLATPSGSYAVHPGMPEVRDLFDQGRLAWLSNVGTLVEPVTLAGIDAGTARLPLGLFSHADQIAQWQTALPDKRSAIGWGGRLAEALAHLNGDSQVGMSLSLAGTNVFQSGEHSVPFSLSPDGVVGIKGYGDSEALNTKAIDGLTNAHYRNIFERAYASRLRSAIDDGQRLKEALEAAPAVASVFGADEFGSSLAMVARSIAARRQLGLRRQTFFLLFGGWDHHDNALVNQQQMLPLLSKGLGDLQAALDGLGVADQVTTFTVSDFGRTLSSNGQGSDHGWGGNMVVMGGGVKGGRSYGSYPQLAPGNSLDTGRGRLIPTTSVDEYFAELALWFGADSSSLDFVLPNLGRFYTPGDDAPVGFLL